MVFMRVHKALHLLIYEFRKEEFRFTVQLSKSPENYT